MEYLIVLLYETDGIGQLHPKTREMYDEIIECFRNSYGEANVQSKAYGDLVFGTVHL